MASKALAVKYRPHTFEDVCEQEAIVTILKEQISTKTFQHSYLFCGPAGCGKTTMARIFADRINSGKGNPIEIDGASNNGVDNIREVIEGAKRKSLDSEYKVYIIDEVHMLSIGAFNALLKTLEEPPKYTIFILATTDPQKIPATIISRVQRYNFSKISTNTITRRLSYILESEKVTEYEQEAVEYISKVSCGGMRDAITMLDKCLSLTSDLTVQSVVTAIGAVDYELQYQLLKALHDRSDSTAVATVEDVHSQGKDLKLFISNFLYYTIDVSKFLLFGNFDYLQIPPTKENEVRLAALTPDSVNIIMDLVMDLNSVVKWESNPLYIIEAVFISYCKEAK